jgi:hypothetical protein
VNFRSIADIKQVNELKKYDSEVRPPRCYDVDLNAIKMTLGGKGLLGYSVGNDDKHFLAKQMALAKQHLNVGRLAQAIKMLEDLKKDGYKHADLFYMLGECYRRTSNL